MSRQNRVDPLVRRLLSRVRDETAGDRGAGTVEYIGVLLVVGALVLSLLMAASPLGGSIAAKLCQALGTTCAAPGAVAQEKAPPTDPCTVQTDDTNVKFGVSVAFIDIGDQGKLAVQKMSDGTYKVTVGGDLGVDASLTAGEAKGKLVIADYGGELGAEASISGGVFAGAGNEYTFKNAADAGKFTDWVTRQVAKQGIKSIASGVSPGVGLSVDLGGWLLDKITGYDYSPPSPTATYYEGGVTAGGSASAGALTAGASADVEAKAALGMKLDHTNGDRTIYTKVTVDADAAVTLGLTDTNADWGAGADGKATVELVVGTTVDKDNKVTAVSLDGAATAEGSGNLTALVGYPLQGGGGKGVQMSASFDVTDANRAQVMNLLAGVGAVTLSSGSPAAGVASAIPQLIDQARRNGDVTAQFVDVSSSTLLDAALAVKAPAVGGLGFSAGADTSSTTSTSAHYLADHGWKDWTACGR